MISAHIDSHDLETFLRVLGRVKDNDGRLDYGDIWFDASTLSKAESPDLDGRLSRTKILNAHKETLVRLRKSLEKTLCAEEEAPTSSCPLPGGTDVNSLPFEILSRIFVLTVDHDVDDYEENVHPRSLSHVCRRFRATAFQTPCLWNLVATGRPLKETEMYLEVSKPTPLIVIVDDPSFLVLPDFMAAVLPHSHRWASLHITVHWETFDKCVGFAQLCGDIQFPMLTELQHELAVSHYDDDEWNELFTCNLLMPQLTSYSAFNIMPRLFKQCVGGVTHCALHENSARSNNGNTVDMSTLFLNLKVMPNLRNLSLRFRHVPPLEEDDTDLDVVELPFVDTFALALEGGSEVEEIKDIVFRNLKLPNVVELSLELRLVSCRTNKLLSDFDIPVGPVPFANLRQLHYEDHTTFRSAQLESILHRCKSLVEFKLHTPQIRLFGWSGPDVWSSHLPLRTLHLAHCDAVSPKDVRRLVNKLKGGPVWDTFQKLEIRKCKQLSGNFFLAIEDELEGKLNWRTASKDI